MLATPGRGQQFSNTTACQGAQLPVRRLASVSDYLGFERDEASRRTGFRK